MEWLKDIKKEELPENYQEMLQLLVKGNETKKIAPSVPDEAAAKSVVLALSIYYNKQGFYFSGIDAMISRKKREFVIRNRGRRVAELARITGFSERTIYDIFEEQQRNKQRDLFARGDAEGAEKAS